MLQGYHGQFQTRSHILEFAQNLLAAITDPKAPNAVTLENFALRRVWEQMVGPVEETLAMCKSQPGFVEVTREAGLGAAGSTLFVKITGELISKHVVGAYDLVQDISSMLAEEIPTRFRKEDFMAFDDTANVETVEENMPYPDSSIGERFYGSNDATKKGRLLALTEEAVYLDQTGQMLMRANSLGRNAAYTKGKAIVDMVQDIDPEGTANNVFLPQGVAEALYRTTAGTNSSTVNKTAANAFTDWTSIDAAFQIFRAMTNTEGLLLGIPPNLQLLVPESLYQSAFYTVNASNVFNKTGLSQGDFFGTAPANVPSRSVGQPLSSAHLDTQSETTWYIGDFKRQFKWRVLWPIQVMRGTSQDDTFRRDIVAPFKVRYWGGVAVTEDHYVVQCPAS